MRKQNTSNTAYFSASLRLCASFCIAFLACACAMAESFPPEWEGKFPVHIPEYDGVEQFQLLSNRWVIVCTTNIDEVLDAIDQKLGGEFKRSAEKLKQTAGERGNLSRRLTEELRRAYLTNGAAAREEVGERQLNDPAYYAITSANDETYKEPLAPSRAAYYITALDQGQRIGAPDVHFGLYSYIEFPEPMKDGKRYTVALKNGKKVTFLYDEKLTVSRAIKVNQAGYLPSAKRKFAYLGAHLYGIGPLPLDQAKTFQVIDVTTGEVALNGNVTLREKDPQFAASPRRREPPRREVGDRIEAGDSPEEGERGDAPGGTQSQVGINGEDVYEIDLSGLTATGTFFIHVPGVGRSWSFRHAPDAYGDAFYTSMRGFYHQRCGTALTPPYTQWPRQLCHTQPVYESDLIVFGIGEFEKPREYRGFDVTGATTDKSRKTDDARGGWHDAADWDRTTRHFSIIFDLLYAYELAPAKFTDGQLNLPESGNGIPDILDEVDYGMLAWTKSMDDRGGVSGGVLTWTHPDIDQDIDYTYTVRTRWNTLVYAAAAAQLSQQLRQFDPAKADAYAVNAKKAYAFGANPENSLGKIVNNAAQDRGRGAAYTIAWEEKEAMVQPYLALAKVRMFLLTGDKSYVENIEQHLKGALAPTEWPYTFKDYSTWFYFSLLAPGADILPAAVAEGYRKRWYLEPANELVKQLDEMPYRQTWPRSQARNMAFGASDMMNPGRLLLIAYALTKDERYRDAAILNADFMFGANPLGMSWTTGIGSAYPVVLQHEISRDDGIRDPVPGITLYGVTEGIFDVLNRDIWMAPTRRQREGRGVPFVNVQVPMWRRWSAHPKLNTGQCEFTVHETMASTAFTCAMLLPENWKPSDALVKRGPRDEKYLFGYWYLP